MPVDRDDEGGPPPRRPSRDQASGPGQAGQAGEPAGFSRRDFIRGGAAAGATALIAGTAATLEAPPPAGQAGKVEAGVRILGPHPVAMSFRINGTERHAELEPRVTLLDALRNHFDLTGAKRVCDRGTCGACTVLLDGKTVYACSVLAIEAQGRAVETVEGLGSPEHLHPLQAALVENDAQQCGFCTPGFVMAAKALLDRNPAPRLADVHHALSGNFCRCGTYAGLRAAVLSAGGGSRRAGLAGGFAAESALTAGESGGSAERTGGMEGDGRKEVAGG